MKIRTQLIISMVFFGVVLAIISASVIATNQQVDRLNKQEELAKNIELKAGELSYLSNNYLLYHESQQIDRWEYKYSSISADVSNLTVDQPEQLVLINNIRNSQQRLKEIFGDISLRVKNTSIDQSDASDMAFVQISDSRIGVQTQGMIFDASRLSQSLREQADEAKQQNNLFIFVLIGVFVAFLLTDYLLIYGRTLKSISNLQDGTRIIGSGNLDYSIIEKGDDEVSGLARAFNQMTASLKTVTASKADLEKEIAERKRAMNEVESLAKFPKENPNPVIRVAADGTLIYANPSSTALLDSWGCRVGQMLPIDYGNLVQETLRSGNGRKIEASSGSTVYSLFFTPILDMGYVNIYGRDITERKQAEVALQGANEELETAAEELRLQNEELMSAQSALQESERLLEADLDAMTRLQKLGALFVSGRGLEPVLIEIVDAAIAVSGADFGNIQLLDPKTSELKIVAQRGFEKWWLDFWNNVSKGQGACGTALERGGRVIVEDVEKSQIFIGTPALDIQRRAGVRAVQSTPLVSRSGKLLGMFSTHYKTPHIPDDNALRLLDLLARQAADIIERAQIESALNASEEKYRTIVETTEEGIATHDPDGTITYVNQRMADMLGYSREEIIGRSSLDFVDDEERKAVIGARNSLKEQGSFSKERKMRRKDGSILWTLVNATPRRDGAGNFIGYLAMHSDITERKKAEEALRKSRDELEIRVHERTGELSQVNKKLEGVNITLIDEIKGHKDARDKLQQEIEEHKQTEEKLLRAKDAAEAATRAKAEFLANMSHEIRTPMNSVIGFTELLLDDSDDPLSPEQKDNLESIRINGNALLTIINDILDFSKMESDKLVLEDQPFNLRQCVEESLDLVSIRASEKGLNLSYTIDKEVPDTIIGDPGRLRQVLGNLLSNAVKFTDEGEVTISVSSQQIDGINEVHFAVQDTGIGIPQDSINQLFQPFTQMEPSTTRLYGGTGLGLAISKKLVEMMNGKIWAGSQEGVGSTFHFTIKASSDKVSPKPAVVSPQLIGKSVLIAADNRTNRRILSKQVYDFGMVPVPARSGQEALSWISRGDVFDIAILDMDLEDIEGLELEEKIRKYNKTLPMVLLTSLGKRVPPGHAYLTKPIKPAQLYKILTEILPGTGISPRANVPRDDIDILPKEPSQSLAVASGADQPRQNKPLKILLAEDNMSSQQVTLLMLKKLGYRADVVANGIEALQSLERQHYDVVLMDVKMPEMDGLEATRIIRQRWPHDSPKIIAITAYALEGDREKCLGAGMDDYIAKPVQKEDLARVLKEINRL